MIVDGSLLAKAFERNHWVIRAQTEGLSHTDSLITTPYNINTLNWVVGHVVDYRWGLVKLLGGERPSEETGRYRKESEPVTEDGPGVLSLDRLLEMLDATQEILTGRLADLGDDDWARETQVGERSQTLVERVHFLYFHDTYHTGQTELLRQVAGSDDKII